MGDSSHLARIIHLRKPSNLTFQCRQNQRQ
jgi:hypothetical protein